MNQLNTFSKAMNKNCLIDKCEVDRFQATRSSSSFETLYKRYAQKVYRTCLAMTNDSMDAQDYTQEIFIRVFQKLSSFQNRSSFSTWLYTISYRYCLDQLQLNKRLQTVPLPDSFGEREPIEYGLGGRPTELAENRRPVQEAALNKLPHQERELLLLRYEYGYSIQQIGEQYNLSESAVKMRLKRTRDRLRQTVLPW